MIASIAELFVERVDASAGWALTAARRLLVVDATGHAKRVGQVFAALELISATSCSVVALEDVDSLPDVAQFEVVWLLVGEEFDSDYGSLVVVELARRFTRSRVERLRVSQALATGTLQGSLPWRRRSAVESSARSLAERLGP